MEEAYCEKEKQREYAGTCFSEAHREMAQYRFSFQTFAGSEKKKKKGDWGGGVNDT